MGNTVYPDPSLNTGIAVTQEDAKLWVDTATEFWVDTSTGELEFWVDTATGELEFLVDTATGDSEFWVDAATSDSEFWVNMATGDSEFRVDTATGDSEFWVDTATGDSELWVNTATVELELWVNTATGDSELWVNTATGDSEFWVDTATGGTELWVDTATGGTELWVDTATCGSELWFDISAINYSVKRYNVHGYTTAVKAASCISGHICNDSPEAMEADAHTEVYRPPKQFRQSIHMRFAGGLGHLVTALLPVPCSKTLGWSPNLIPPYNRPYAIDVITHITKCETDGDGNLDTTLPF